MTAEGGGRQDTTLSFVIPEIAKAIIRDRGATDPSMENTSERPGSPIPARLVSRPG